METTRNIPALEFQAKGSPDADFFTEAVYGGYNFMTASGWVITPVLGLSLMESKVDGYRERGDGIYNLTYGSNSNSSLELQTSLGVSRQFSMATPRLKVGLSYETGDIQNSVRTTFGELPGTPGFRSVSS